MKPFDLKHEAEQACDMYPHIAHNTVFRDAFPDLRDKSTGLYFHTAAVEECWDKADQELYLCLASKHALAGNFQTTIYLKRNDLWVITVGDMEEERHTFSDTQNKTLPYAYFDHELAHRLLPDASAKNCSDEKDRNHVPLVETLADTYMALRCMQRHKAAGRDILDQLSQDRAIEAIDGGRTIYLSTCAIDAIIQDSYTHNFSLLSIQETLDTAQDYAHRYVATCKETARFRAQFGFAANAFSLPDKDIPGKLSQIWQATQNTHSPFVRYTGLRALQASQGIGYGPDGVPPLSRAAALDSAHQLEQAQRRRFIRLNGLRR